MDYFDRFNSVLKNDFHGDFSAMVHAPYHFDNYQGAGLPDRIKEVDRRKSKENGYITTPDVQLSAEPVVEPVAEEPQLEEQTDIDFKVIDLDEELDKRRKNTEADNPVQPEPVEIVPLKLTPNQAPKKPPRGLASPSEAGTSAKKQGTAKPGNRKQRRAVEATKRKGGKAANKNPRKDSNRDSGSTQEASTPEKVNLRDLGFGFRLE
jgi:hypothetical protein